jgi:hypothetical protein
MESFTWFDEMLANIHRNIDIAGWSLMCVMGDRKHLPFCYTIGLVDRFDHPELCMIGMNDQSMSVPMTELGIDVSEGRRFTVGEKLEVANVPILVGEVHSAHLDSILFSKWHHYYEAVGYPARPPSALQVLWPDDSGFFPGEDHWDKAHDPCQPLLSSSTLPPAPSSCITYRDTLNG